MNFKDYYNEAKKKKTITPAQQFKLDIAELCCVSVQTVNMWLYHGQEPTMLVKKVLANHFNTSVESLFPKH